MNEKNNDVLNSLYNEDGTVKAPYVDQNDTGKFATSVSTENVGVDQDDINSNLGGGLKAAGEMNYSWDNKAQERASLDYKSQVLDTKNQFLTSRQQTESQGKAYQEQVDMQKYSQNQSIDKVGWTGGYVLDTERQMNYLKESIKAQMYGQMELQKYGYETSLAAARLAYDTNKYDLALQYYQQAITNAVTEAAQTGIYRSPEVKEHLDNYKIATDILNGDTEGDKEQAAKLVENIHSWFKDQGISPAGIKTLERLQIESTLDAQKQSQMNAMYELYKIDASKKYKIDIDNFGKINEDGSMSYTKGENGELIPEIINFNNMDAKEILNYVGSSEAARDQYYSRLDLAAYEVENNFTSWCIKNGYLTADESGNITSVGAHDYNSVLTSYLQSNGTTLLQKELNKFDTADPKQVEDLISNWSCDIKLPDDTTVTLSLIKKGTSSGGINVGDTTVNNNGETSFNYQGYYVKGENGTTYIKDCNNLNTLTSVIQGNPEMAAVLKLLEIDPRSENYANAVSDWMNSLQTFLGVGVGAVGGVVGTMVGGPVGTIIGAGIGAIVGDAAGSVVSGAWDLIDDLFVQGFTSQGYKEQVEILSGTITAIENYIGTSNMAILNEASERYKNLSDRDRSLLNENELAQLKYAHSLISSLNNYKEALAYAEKRDSNIWQDPWDYLGDNWAADYEDIWADGYQFGDILQSGVTGIVDIAESGAAVIVGGAQWAWNNTVGKWFGWEW